jgi:hypothetical protein
VDIAAPALPEFASVWPEAAVWDARQGFLARNPYVLKDDELFGHNRLIREVLHQILGIGPGMFPSTSTGREMAGHARFTKSVRIATFRYAAPARCGACVDERRIVAGDGGGYVRTRKVHPVPFGQCGSADCHKMVGVRMNYRELGLERIASPPTGVLIVAFRCAAPRAAARSAMSGGSSPATQARKAQHHGAAEIQRQIAEVVATYKSA